MTHFISLLFLTLVSSLVPAVVSGPACASRHRSKDNCIQVCNENWGWPGLAMGSDPWGLVMKPVAMANGLDEVKTNACKARVGSPPADAAGSSGSTFVATLTSLPSSGITGTPISSKLVASPTSFSSKLTSRHSTHSRSSSHSNALDTNTTPQPAEPTSGPSPKTTDTPDASGGQYLSLHNSFRAQYGAPPLTWSSELESDAQKWAQNCDFQHSNGSVGPWGENLALGSGGFGISQAIQDWMNESSSYNPKNPVASHFTQVVWKATKQLGCVHVQCGDLLGVKFGATTFHVCEYNPAGNFDREFAQNVQV